MLFRRLAVVVAVFLVQTATLAVAQVTLKPKAHERTQFKFREKQKITQIGTIGGQNVDTSADVSTTGHVAYGKRDAEERLTYQITNDTIVLDFDGFGSKVHFDSAQPDPKTNSPITEMVVANARKLSGLTLNYNIDKNDQLLSVEGIKEGSGLDEDDLKSDYKKDRANFPAEPVKQGDTWERTEEMNLGQGQAFVVKRKYEYAGTTAKVPTVKDSPQLDKITATDISVEFILKGPAAAAVKVQQSDLKVAASKNTYLFDRELGRIVNEQSDLTVKGSFKLSANGMEIDGTLDLTLEKRREEIE